MEPRPFIGLLILDVINRFIVGHWVVIYYLFGDLNAALESNTTILATVSKNFKINLEGQNYVYFYVILSRNVNIFGIMASL